MVQMLMKMCLLLSVLLMKNDLTCGSNHWLADGLFLSDSGSGCFEDMPYNDQAIYIGNILVRVSPDCECTSFVIREGTAAILPEAFYYATGIEEVVLPDSVVYIGESAFEQTGIHFYSLPYHLLVIGASAFEACSLSDLSLPPHILAIGTYAFYGCPFDRNEELVLPETIVYLGEDIWVFGESSWDDWTPLFQVKEGSYAQRWAEEQGLQFDILP